MVHEWIVLKKITHIDLQYQLRRINPVNNLYLLSVLSVTDV